MEETLVYFGDSVKSLNDEGLVGGYLVRFTKSDEKDLTGEHFEADTYLGAHEGDGADCLFHHGIPVKPRKAVDGAVKAKIAGLAEHIFEPIKTRRDEIGIWAETVLNQADEYEAEVLKLVKAGKIGWSSGSTQRVVRKSKDGKIERWPIVEGSLTHKPCDPMNRAIAIKSLDDVLFEEEEAKPVAVELDLKQPIKGIFQNELREHTPTYWQYQSAFDSVIRKIATTAANIDIADVNIDVQAKVEEAAREYTDALIPLIVAQINEYISSPQRAEHFYLKGNPFNAVIDAEGNTLAAVTFADHLDSVLAAVKGVANRTRNITEIRTGEMKAGAKISKARMDKLKEIMRQIEALVTEAEPMPADEGKSLNADQILSLAAQFEHINMSLTAAGIE